MPFITDQDKEWFGIKWFSGIYYGHKRDVQQLFRIYGRRGGWALFQIFEQISNYWTSAGPYDEIYYYIEKNVAEVRDDLALMTAGLAVPAKVQEYAATSMNLSTRDEIFSAMVVYGFLSYEAGNVCISNKELMDKFRDMLKKYGAARW